MSFLLGEIFFIFFIIFLKGDDLLFLFISLLFLLGKKRLLYMFLVLNLMLVFFGFKKRMEKYYNFVDLSFVIIKF